MARVRRFNNNFTSGELAPSTFELYNLAKRENGLKTLKNMTITPSGGLVRRDGTRFVTFARNAGLPVRLIPFIFSRTQAYVLELSNNYIRFYRDNGQLIVASSGLPVEVFHPFDLVQTQELDFAQSGDTIIFVHKDVPPQILQRFSDIEWVIKEFEFRPPPTEVRNGGGGGVTTAALLPTGTDTIDVFASQAAFAFTDVGREFKEISNTGEGVGFVTNVISGTRMSINVVKPFSSFFLNGFEWQLTGGPLGNLSISEDKTGGEVAGLKGDYVSMNLWKTPADEAESLANPTFASGSAGWNVNTKRSILTGTIAANSAAGFLYITGNAKELGVQVNHNVVLDTGGNSYEANVNNLTSEDALGNFNIIQLSDTAITPAVGELFEVRETSFAIFNSPFVELHAGGNGIASVSQSWAAQQQEVYEWNVTVSHDSCSIRVGTTDGGADILEKTTLPVGAHTGTFSIPNVDSLSTTTAYITIENNQFNTFSQIENVSVKWARSPGFAGHSFPGDWIRVNNGYIQRLDAPTSSRVRGLVQKQLDDNVTALAGAWTIEKSRWVVGTYPERVAFYQGRLVFTGGLNVWGSALTDIASFAAGTAATDSYSFVPAATQVNPPHWIIGEKVLLIGTRSNEYLVSGTDTAFIGPADLNVSSPTAVGSEPVKPVRVNQQVLFVKGGGKRIMEMNTEGTEDKITKDLSVLANHLVESNDRIKEIAWQEEPHQQLWCATVNGALFSLTYVKEQGIWGWARHDFGDAATVQSLTVIPHPDGDRDQVWFAMRRPGNPQDLIEYFDDDGGIINNVPPATTDSTIRYSGVSTTLIAGLEHLNNSPNVWVVDDQGSQGPFTVDGTGHVSFPRPVTDADIGVNFIPTIETLRPSIDGSGPTGLNIGNTNLFISVINTGDGVTANGKLLKLRNPSDSMDARITPFSGELEIPSLGSDRQAQVTITQSTPEAFTLLSIAGTLVVENI